MAAELTCAESEDLLALAALGVLGADESATLNAHLRHCAGCRAAGRRYQATAKLLPESLELLEPPPSLRRKLLAEVYGAAPPQPQEHRWSALWRRVPQHRALTLVAAGLSVAAAVLATWSATRSASPATQTFTVVGTTSEPAAQGSLTFYPGTANAIVSVRGLSQAPAPAAGVVELWLIPQNGQALPAGFLTMSPQSDTWTAAIHADLSRYAVLAATEEAPGGAPAPHGAQLFSVQLH